LRTGRVVNFGNVGVFRAGNLDASADLFSRSAELAGQAGDNLLLTYIYHGMGYLTLARNELMAAAAAFRRSLRLSMELESFTTRMACVAGLAAVAAGAGDTEQAGELWGAVEKLTSELGFPLHPLEKTGYEELIGAHADIASVAFTAAAERGRGMSVDEICAHALADG